MTDANKNSDATRYFIIIFGDKYDLYPEPFDNESDARKKIEELAIAGPKVRFGLFQKIGTASADLAVTWKGQTG